MRNPESWLCRTHPARPMAGVAFAAFLTITSCAPPKNVDYNAPDASADPDAPVPIEVDPSSGQENVNRLKVIRVTFDKHLNSRTLEQGSLSLYSGTPGKTVVGRWMVSFYDPIHKQLVAWPAGPMLRQSTWVIKLNKGIEGMNGSPVHPVELGWFRTGDDAILETAFKIRSFEREVRPIFEKYCVSCHGGSGATIAGLDLESAEGIQETALNEPASGWQDWFRITPTLPGESYLLFKIIGDENLPGETMPRSFGDEKPTRLSIKEQEVIMEWIAAGVPLSDP